MEVTDSKKKHYTSVGFRPWALTSKNLHCFTINYYTKSAAHSVFGNLSIGSRQVLGYLCGSRYHLYFQKCLIYFRLSFYQKDRIVTFVFITENPLKLLFLNYSELINILQFKIIYVLKSGKQRLNNEE